MALGLSLIWGVMDVINVAHGAFIMLGAYTTYWLFQAGIDPLVSLPISLGLLFILGFLLQKYLINLVIRAELFITLLLTFGIEILIVNLARVVWTANVRRVATSYSGASISIGELTVPLVRVVAFVIALILAGALFVLLERTRMGRAIRATSQDLLAARLTGTNVSNTYAITFGLGAGLAGAAGSLWSMLFPITPTMGGVLTLKSFVVSVIGGLGTMAGPVIGGLVLGVAENFTSAYIGPTFPNLVSFGLLVITLILRPRGILGGRR
ncbi:MAG: branched-chain amino acid ABC transporter permease [Chloroflexi bacterium]|nr:MAG: branched-chain amino acid ABC transporter permease [Chloroflexota bacterium]